MSQIIKYFDAKGNEVESEKAVEIIVQDIDEKGKLLKESVYFKE
jgi:hypothetical protein